MNNMNDARFEAHLLPDSTAALVCLDGPTPLVITDEEALAVAAPFILSAETNFRGVRVLGAGACALIASTLNAKRRSAEGDDGDRWEQALGRTFQCSRHDAVDPSPAPQPGVTGHPRRAAAEESADAQLLHFPEPLGSQLAEGEEPTTEEESSARVIPLHAGRPAN